MARLMCWSGVILASACAPRPESPLVGAYYRGDGTGFDVMLWLEPRGEYSATWAGCRGTYARDEGDWSRDGDIVVLEPAGGSGVHGLSRRLKIVANGTAPILVPEEELTSAYFLRYGPDRFVGFHRLDDDG